MGASRPLLSQLSRTAGNVSNDQKPSAEMSLSAGSRVASCSGRGKVPQVIQVWPIFIFLACFFLAKAEGNAIVPSPRAMVFSKLRRSSVLFMVDSLILLHTGRG